MDNVRYIKESDRKKHVYELDNCSMCQKEIENDEKYTEIVMEMTSNIKKHIALCLECSNEAERNGFI